MTYLETLLNETERIFAEASGSSPREDKNYTALQALRDGIKRSIRNDPVLNQVFRRELVSPRPQIPDDENPFR